MPTASLRSPLLICILRAALACLASMQMTGNPSLFSSVQSHVAVAPVSSPTRATCGACNLMNIAIASGSEGTPLPVRSFLFDRQCRSLSASAIHPIQHSIPLRSAMNAKPMCGLVGSWRADSSSVGMARCPELPHVEKLLVSTRSNFFSGVGAVFRRGRGGPHNPLLTQPRQF